MSKAYPQIAIVEEEFLIAVDAEYLISEGLECRVSIVRPDEMERVADEELSLLDLCLVDLPIDAGRGLALALRLRKLGVACAFTSVSEVHRHGVAGFEQVPVVMKPFDGETLLAVVRTLLDAPRPPQN